MNKVKFQHKAIVTITNVTMYALISSISALLLGAVCVGVISAMSDVAPKFIYDLDIALNGM